MRDHFSFVQAFSPTTLEGLVANCRRFFAGVDFIALLRHQLLSIVFKVLLSMRDKITVIGGAGFVGTNLCRLLKRQQREFEILDLTPSQEFPQQSKVADVRDVESLRESITGQIVINLAAVHRDDITDPMQYHATNVLGAKNIVNVCTEKHISKIIFTSSVAFMGSPILKLTKPVI